MTAPFAAGTLFAERYRIIRLIAAGGMGAVYEVIHVETERRRALKVMHPHLFQSADMHVRFKREARIAANIESEFIVDVSDAGVDEATQTPFLVMELLRGEELKHRIKRLGRLPVSETITCLSQLASALDKTHANAIVHRDLKPDNIFVTTREDGSLRIKILDFGIAKVVAEGVSGGTTEPVGTPLYMAPEQWRESVKLTPAADIYALGMMTFTMITGKPYWKQELDRAGGLVQFALLATKGTPETASKRAAPLGIVLSPAFDRWFERATALRPENRFTRATEAVRALEAVLADMAPDEAPTTKVQSALNAPELTAGSEVSMALLPREQKRLPKAVTAEATAPQPSATMTVTPSPPSPPAPLPTTSATGRSPKLPKPPSPRVVPPRATAAPSVKAPSNPLFGQE